MAFKCCFDCCVRKQIKQITKAVLNINKLCESARMSIFDAEKRG